MNRPSVLPGGMRLVGDIEGDEDLVVFGDVDGEIRLGGALVVEATGRVRGNVSARSIAIRGIVIGDATGIEAVRVDDGACVVGDLHAPRVQVVKGAKLRGHVKMAETQSSSGALRSPMPIPRLKPIDVRPPRDDKWERREPAQEAIAFDTVPGTLEAVDDGSDQGERRPPAPFVPSIRRARGRRRERTRDRE